MQPTSPTHPKALAYLQWGIFDELKSFREFEARISALSIMGEGGAAFEVFVEAYLATLAVEKAKGICRKRASRLRCASASLYARPTWAWTASWRLNSARFTRIRQSFAPAAFAQLD
ncbi:MAG: hypothetical protein M3463_05065 [Verrucomicrobiota bacterium]|nr:hypothetical protein [Verrucomicrobiota bacterium]